MIPDSVAMLGATVDPWRLFPVVVSAVALVIVVRDVLNALGRLAVRFVEDRGWM